MGKKEKAVEVLVSIFLSWDNARTSGALRRVQILDMAFAIKVKIVEGGWRYAVKRLHGSLWLVVPDRSYEQSCPSPHVLVSGLSSRKHVTRRMQEYNSEGSGPLLDTPADPQHEETSSRFRPSRVLAGRPKQNNTVYASPGKPSVNCNINNSRGRRSSAPPTQQASLHVCRRTCLLISEKEKCGGNTRLHAGPPQ